MTIFKKHDKNFHHKYNDIIKLVKDIYGKSTTKSYFMLKQRTLFPKDRVSKAKISALTHHFYSYCIRTIMQWEKKKEAKLPLFACNLTLYIGNHKMSIKLLELINKI